MPAIEATWTEAEQAIAKEAFQRAYDRETEALVADVKRRLATLSELDDIWNLHDYLSARRHSIDGKYDYRYSILLFVFSQLLKEGWLGLTDLEGLEPEKLKKVSALARM